MKKKKSMGDKLQKFIVFGENNRHEFDIIVDEMGVYRRRYSLHYSDNPPWNENIRGKIALQLTDTGDNFIFTPSIKKFDYDIASCVRILLNFASLYETNKITYSIVEHNVKLKF
jgi:hypothetical protein